MARISQSAMFRLHRGPEFSRAVPPPLSALPWLAMVGLIGMVLNVSLGHPAAAAADPAPLPPPAPRPVDFGKDIHPILAAHCFQCHQGNDAASGRRLDLRAELLGESDGKPMVHIGQSADSRLIHVVAGRVPDRAMPPKGEPLSAEQIGLLRAWIDQGLSWDDKLLPPLGTGSTHWAFQPPKRPPMPPVKNAAWVRNPIDAFIAAQHEKLGLEPAAPAAPGVLLRRLCLDLTGLPPTPEQVAAFEQAASRDPAAAYDQLVTELLASPHYGERWGRHWLDLARWAESEGYESNHPRLFAWRYRDYVIRSFNEDKPYSLFLRQQLAGDEMLPYSDENLIATGFLAAARLSSNEEDKALQRQDILVDIVNATSNSLLGLTMNCAQCHNHKFDPLTARDYYRFLGFFIKGQPANLVLQDKELWRQYEAARPADYESTEQHKQTLLDKAHRQLIETAKQQLSDRHRQALATPEPERTPEMIALAREANLRFQFTPNQIERAITGDDRKLYDELKKKLEEMDKRMPPKPQTFGFYSPATSPTPVETLPMKGFYPLPYVPAELARAQPRLLLGGDVHRVGPVVDVGWPAVFGPTSPQSVEKRPRLALADWLTQPDHPLTARVWVNRLWHYHWGRGIVATPSDFGVKGAKPTHPELLDWLATELVQNNWSTKHIHRLIVTSNTYRQASRHHAVNAKLDPDNRFWWRWSPRRLEAEAIRDAMLTVSGELDRQLFGPSTADETTRRRSLYLTQTRDKPPATQALFDGPAAIAESCPVRHVSTVPLQALFLLNNDFAFHHAQALAQRVATQAGPDRRRQIATAFEVALGRLPDPTEQRTAEAFFQRTATEDDGDMALIQFCQALLNVNEFVYLE
ncbi:MAG: PSD1 and planctomycete cytochrome C domain-containing protein [Gemmataceae bacterium]